MLRQNVTDSMDDFFYNKKILLQLREFPKNFTYQILKKYELNFAILYTRTYFWVIGRR